MSDLSLRNVSKSFGGLKAVTDVTLEVPAGRITGLIGPNGAGKSTLVNLICGQLALTQGHITLGSREITTVQPCDIGKAGIARTFQNLRLLPEATVIENVAIGFHRLERASLLSAILGLGAAVRETRLYRERAGELLERFGMSRYAHFPASVLSYGHQRKVEIMRAIASDPSILLLDEPVAGMNDVEAAELGTIFKSLTDKGMGVLLIEHNLSFVTRMCSFLYVLDEGRMIASGFPGTVIADPAVISAYIGV